MSDVIGPGLNLASFEAARVSTQPWQSRDQHGAGLGDTSEKTVLADCTSSLAKLIRIAYAHRQVGS